MAGEWTPIEHATPKKPEIIQIAAETSRSRHEVLGLMIEFWAWAETRTTTGKVQFPPRMLPEVIGGDADFWRAVVRAGWMKISEKNTIENAPEFKIPRASHWLTKGAKSRLLATKRQQKRRDSVATTGEKRTANTRGARVDRERIPEKNTSENATEVGTQAGFGGSVEAAKVAPATANGSGERRESVTPTSRKQRDKSATTEQNRTEQNRTEQKRTEEGSVVSMTVLSQKICAMLAR